MIETVKENRKEVIANMAEKLIAYDLDDLIYGDITWTPSDR